MFDIFGFNLHSDDILSASVSLETNGVIKSARIQIVTSGHRSEETKIINLKL